MAFPAEADLKKKVQGGKLSLLAGHTVYPQFFCCISGNTVGVDKDPVALIKGDVADVCPNVAVCVDIRDSWSPTSTIATWEVDWDDGNVSNGAWAPAGETCHPFGGYTVAGEYEITVTVTDLLGATGSAVFDLTVHECPPDPPPVPVYIAGAAGGGGPAYSGSWIALNHHQLVPVGSKTCRSLHHYEWADGKESVFMGTDCGIYEYCYLPAGSGGWIYRQNPTDIVGPLGIAGTVGVMDFDFAVGHDGWGVCAWTCDGPWPNSWSGICTTQDGFKTIDKRALIVGPCLGPATLSKVAIAQHSDMQTMYYTAKPITCGGGVRIYKSTLGGANGSWVLKDTQVGQQEGDVYVPWYWPGHDDSIVYWLITDDLRRSTDGGNTWSSVLSPLPSSPRGRALGGPAYDPYRVSFCTWDSFVEWVDGVGATEWNWGRFAGEAIYEFSVVERDSTWAATKVLIGGDTALGGFVRELEPGGVWRDVGANWDAVSGNQECISIMHSLFQEFECPLCGS